MESINFISNTDDIVDNSGKYSFFNENGESVDSKDVSYAYIITYPRRSPKYFIYSDRDGIVNPHSKSPTINRSKFISTKVTEECFNAYLQFLKTANSGFLLLARRKING